jgi:hypothetical protein
MALYTSAQKGEPREGFGKILNDFFTGIERLLP